MADARASQVVRRALTDGAGGSARTSQVIRRALVEIGIPVRVSQVVRRALVQYGIPIQTSQVIRRSLVTVRPCLTRECQIWTIRRKDGTVYRFTSLDRDLKYGGQTYKACDSMVPSASSSANEVGSVGDINLSGIVGEGAGSVTLADLHAGRLDGAFVEARRVSWDGTTEPKAIMRGTFGSVSFGERGFSVDLTGDGARLQQTPLLRTVAPGCDLVFGSAPCGKALGPLTVTGTAATGQGQRGFTDPTRTEPDGYFNYGRVTFTTGANAGISAEIKSHAAGVFALWPRLAEPVSAGDAYSMTPGCSNLMEAAGGTNGCLAWDNRINYGGFEQVPGDDAMNAVPKAKA